MIGAFALVMLIAACSDNDDSTTNTLPTASLSINIQGLEDLGGSFRYEGWILVDGSPISTGVFSVNQNGVLSQTEFQVSSEMLNEATKFILTVEPNPDPDPNPSDQKLIAGDFNGNSAQLNTSVAPGIGDFSTVSGDFFLRTPTDEPVGTSNNGNDQYGVWFGLPGMPPSATLNLPELPLGWVYEGWVIGDSGPLTTGRFSSAGEMDFNAGTTSSYGGTEQLGPNLPGEDFFNNAPLGENFPLDLRGRTVVISIEPEPDNSPAPFLLKPLVGTAGMDTAPSSYGFSSNLSSFPMGNVSR